jgi:Reverse transcriptase (RNA-dependent DNA polymerase)
MLAKKFIQQSTFETASPLLIIPKKNGEKRICIDYRALNTVTEKEGKTFPVVDDMIWGLNRKKVFTTIDLSSVYNQLRMAKTSEKSTTFSTPFGNYLYTVMPFGLCNAPAIFHRFMNQLLLPVLGDSCCVYLDDVMLSHDCLESHVKTLGHLLSIFADNNIIGNLKKSKFMVNEIEFLGHKVYTEGITPLPEYKEKAINFSTPKTKKEVQKLMGTLNYIKKFIPNYEIHMTKIYELLKSNERTIKWNEEHEIVLSEIKKSID